MANDKPNPLASLLPQQGLDAIQEHYDKLNSMLASQPQLDYEKIFAPYLQKLQAPQPTDTRKPGALEAFARGFGSPEGAKSVMEQLAASRSEQAGRQQKVMETQRDILEAKAQQELAKGNAAQALKTNQAQAELEYKLAEIKRQQDETTWQQHAQTLFGQKKDIENIKQTGENTRSETRASAAKNIAAARLHKYAVTHNFDEKLLLAAFNKKGSGLEQDFMKKIASNPLTGEKVDPEDAFTYREDYEKSIDQLADSIRADHETITNPGAAKPAPADTTAKKTPARIVYEKIKADREAAAKKKGK